jgi:hypothetical protein
VQLAGSGAPCEPAPAADAAPAPAQNAILRARFADGLELSCAHPAPLAALIKALRA